MSVQKRLILAGCGEWARTRTLLPFLYEHAKEYAISYITDLRGGQVEFFDICSDIERLNRSRPIPDSISTDEFTQVAIHHKDDFERCYDQEPDGTYIRKDVVFEQDRLTILDHLYDANVSGYTKIANPVYEKYLNDAMRFDVTSINKSIAVIINTPNCLHTELAVDALYNSYHVYSERPINPSGHKDSLYRILVTAENAGRLVYSGLQRRLEDTFRYLFTCVEKKIDFGDLDTVSIRLLSGRKLKDWRKNKNLAGGGVVTDEGYHLIDSAAWILSADDPNLRIKTNLNGEILFRDEYGNVCNGNENKIETEARGTIIIEKQTRKRVYLFIDLSYAGPLHTVHEMIEIRDVDGNRIRLLRDQARRSPKPATILHQKANGEFVSIRMKYTAHDGIEEDLTNFVMKSDNFAFNSPARNTGPLDQFLENVSRINAGETVPISECDVRQLENTDSLITAIYRVAHQMNTWTRK